MHPPSKEDNQNSLPPSKSRPKKGTTSQRDSSQKPLLQQHLPDTFRSLPQSLEAEKGILCSALLSPQSVLGECVERIDEHHFYHPAHKTLYCLLIELWNSTKPIDFITITQTLQDRHLLDHVGGAPAISEFFTFLGTAANANYYIEIIREKYLLRQIIEVCTEFAARGYDQQSEVNGLLDEVEGKVLAIGANRFKGNLLSMRDQVLKAVDDIESIYKNRGGLLGLPTGFSELNQMTGGLRGSEMFIIAARPSMGKTAFAMNIAEHVAIEAQKPVGVFSLEMSSQQLVHRLLCSRARVNLKRIRDGFLTPQDTQRITQAASVLGKSMMYIDDTSGISILEFRAKARRMKDQFGIELLVIDYLQLMRSNSRRAQDNRQVEIAEISSGIKALAKELDIPIIVLAQLNRKPDERGGRPRLSDLRESGSIEQDADIVGLLVRSEYYQDNEEDKQEKAGEAELIIAKQRNGPVGDIPLTFLNEFTRFENRSDTGDM